jgi:hypothetical protein
MEPRENPDWGFARNRRVLLRRPNAEFSQSVFSTRIGPFTAPNRDCAYEGLYGYVGGENWKFLDAVFFAFKPKGGGFAELVPDRVTAWPWKAHYSYSFDSNSRLEVEYYLFKRNPSPVLNVSFKALDSRGRALDGSLAVRPLVDVRHMYSPSKPEEHAVQALKHSLLISRSGASVLVHSPTGVSVSPAGNVQNWRYKLGDGRRRVTHKGVEFVGEERALTFAGDLEASFNRGRCDLFVACARDGHEKPVRMLPRPDEAAEVARLQLVLKDVSNTLKKAREAWGAEYAGALAARTLVLLEKFWIDAGPRRGEQEALDAGFGWFRSVWWRDVFETLLQNFNLFMRFNRREFKRLITTALGLQRNGLIPLKQSERAGEGFSYEAIDSTLLCLLTAARFAREARDKNVEKLFYDAFTSFLKNAESEKGPIAIEDGLIACPAAWGWVDSFNKVHAGGSESKVPARIPREWLEKFGSKAEVERFSNGSFFLLEVNAQWLALLRELLELKPPEDVDDRARVLMDRASDSFKEKFSADNTLAHVACDDFGPTAEKSSIALEALALAPWLFSEGETGTIFNASKRLFVKRDKKLFGALLRDAGEKTFFDDGQYHGRVVWPRETPYLIAVLNRLGETKLVEELLLSNLEHQNSEGAVFYSHELFSLPEGVNPSPAPESQNPVPVKNPAQLWSQWTQAYYDFLGKT